jgi:(S)-2-hydroxy-acid oxidase
MSGANDEISLSRNKSYFNKILMYPKILKDVSRTDLNTVILGRKISSPILIAPTALHKLAHPEGELATARAAKEADTIMILSTMSSVSMEKVAEANGDGERWLQLYVMKDEIQTIEILKLAEKSGYTGIMITVDAPVLGSRERDFQIKFKVPQGVKFENLEYTLKRPTKVKKDIEKILEDNGSKSELFEFFAKNNKTSLTWDFIPWIRKHSKLKIILKGVHRVDDALIASKLGVDAIMVSNHGARQLDTVPSTIEMLTPISKALKNIPDNKIEIYVDGGISRGTDVFKALALGAKAVFIGRPILWGLACDGEKGVIRVLDLLKNELILAMKLSGCQSLDEINEDYIRVKGNFAKF